MNPPNEFIFITCSTSVIFGIVIIGLIIANKNQKTEVKKSHFTINQVKEKWHESSIVWHKSDTDKDNVIKQLNSEVKFKDYLIHGYKKDIEKAKDMENLWRTECDKRYQNHLEDEQKLKEAIEYLEELNGKSMSQVAELNKTNEAWKSKYNKLKCDSHNEIKEFETIIDEYQLFILNNAK